MKLGAYSTSETSPTQIVDSADAVVLAVTTLTTAAEPDFVAENHFGLFLLFACTDSSNIQLNTHQLIGRITEI
jgi:hypothetical protein